MNFKKIRVSESVYAEDGFISNSSCWVFSVEWLNQFPSRENLQLRKRAERVRTNTVTTRLQGSKVDTIGIQEVVKLVDLSTFRKAYLSETKQVMGFKGGDPFKHEAVALCIRGAATLDIEFTPALYWDSEVTIMVRKNTDPVVIVKAGKIVGLISPIVIK
jgi:hypothetical protein